MGNQPFSACCRLVIVAVRAVIGLGCAAVGQALDLTNDSGQHNPKWQPFEKIK